MIIRRQLRPRCTGRTSEVFEQPRTGYAQLAAEFHAGAAIADAAADVGEEVDNRRHHHKRNRHADQHFDQR
jgi:hypothetical protein